MNVNKEIMDYIMSDGTILWEDHNMTPEGVRVDCYIVEEGGVKYTMTKHDDEWIYINAEVGGRK